MNSRFILILMTLFLSLSAVHAANVYNENGDFSVGVEELKTRVFNDNIDASFSFEVKNNQGFDQDFTITIPEASGWDIETPFESFQLARDATQEVVIRFSANSNFDYSDDVISPDVIVIAQKDEYVGFFEFPVVVAGENENVSMKFEVSIDRREELPVEFDTRISPVTLSPISPLKFTINADNLKQSEQVEVTVVLGEEELSKFTEEFTPEIDYKIFSNQIPLDVSPGMYNVFITTKVFSEDGSSAQEWYGAQELEVVAYKKISEDRTASENIFKDKYSVIVTNEGNVKDTYTTVIEMGPFSSLLFSATLDGKEFESTDTKAGAQFDIDLERGESKELVYSFNYLALYIIFVILVVLAIYIYLRKTSNPLDVETSLYEIKRVEHEGVKSMKVRIGFENIKENEIDDLRIIFRMPNYLQVKDGSFSLTEPKHVLKGRSQFKLLWDFKRFEKDDSRIVGFTLVNKKGVLGDIKVPDLEIEVKVDGKVRKYFHSFPVIKG